METHPRTTTFAPQIGFGLVRHTRLRPVRHAFRYGVFYLRMPLRSLDRMPLESRLVSRNRFNALSFHDSDHGDGSLPLAAWADALLHQHGIEDADGEIWLQTFPRVFGYVFNPVSFWFCHRADNALRAVICEVNNTFGERHYYLLETGTGISNGQELAAGKIFHVSPFCKVEGRYRFRFGERTGPAASMRRLARIDYHDAEGLLLETSISGEERPLTDRAAAKALLAHPMMTIGVMAKIHWQALKLWLRRVPFHFKPPPPAAKVTR